ncbi:hypothetical protein C7B65_01250 [Phormidesmis priestleyi ULC007]|uniref:Uncharacterized protein n=1 Tax=Phormidesmis priestleyi ULC007 TaxID=1920490 RepID=A0A2T1DNJ0_9CYAN|nr:hypothetical protein [Phormidesmis priestleyi]PSB22067.1 hypothetical protein C7B65_01250 [Phormidesmis priestleyi ULC007]PZO54965.1 MAG: hypothetical protein DCF14_00325 [Phormidesmis priestleyi]
MSDREHPGESELTIALPEKDPNFQAAVQRLHKVTVYGRWLTVLGLWLTVGSVSLWSLRYPISLLQDYFTWAAVRWAIVFQPLPAIGLGLCVAMTLAVLVWQSRNILVGLPKVEQQRLEKQVLKIREQGSSHPLWRWVYPE